MPETSPWAEDLFDFAFIPAPDEQLGELSKVAEEEDWTYQRAQGDHVYPILFNYVRYTYRRVAEENKIGLSEDGQFSCFNTGLVTPNQEPVYASFEANRNQDAQPWYLNGWFRRGQRELIKFPELPDLAHYFEDPTCLVFDTRKDFRVNIEHIIADTPKGTFSATLNLDGELCFADRSEGRHRQRQRASKTKLQNGYTAVLSRSGSVAVASLLEYRSAGGFGARRRATFNFL